MPLWVQIVIIIVLLCLTGLFAGLNLGLMSLDTNELKVIASCGTEQEKIHARTIAPLRSHGNYLLCTILLSNVMINSTLTVLLDQLTSGLIAVISSTLSIVIFGDIIPQAICSRHGLAIGAKTVYIMYFFMLLTFPMSYPISKILDYILGEEIGQVYDRQKLMEFIRVTKDYSHLAPDEVIIHAIPFSLSLSPSSFRDMTSSILPSHLSPVTQMNEMPFNCTAIPLNATFFDPFDDREIIIPSFLTTFSLSLPTPHTDCAFRWT